MKQTIETRSCPHTSLSLVFFNYMAKIIVDDWPGNGWVGKTSLAKDSTECCPREDRQLAPEARTCKDDTERPSEEGLRGSCLLPRVLCDPRQRGEPQTSRPRELEKGPLLLLTHLPAPGGHPGPLPTVPGIWLHPLFIQSGPYKGPAVFKTAPSPEPKPSLTEQTPA